MSCFKAQNPGECQDQITAVSYHSRKLIKVSRIKGYLVVFVPDDLNMKPNRDDCWKKLLRP